MVINRASGQAERYIAYRELARYNVPDDSESRVFMGSCKAATTN